MKNITQIYNPSYKNTEIDAATKVSIEELNTIPNGSIENIYCDILDSIPFSKRINIQNELMKKVMINGSIRIKTINSILLAKKILKNDISNDELNNIINNTVSILDQQYLDMWMNQNQNYIIEKIDLDYLYTYITLKRIR